MFPVSPRWARLCSGVSSTLPLAVKRMAAAWGCEQGERAAPLLACCLPWLPSLLPACTSPSDPGLLLISRETSSFPHLFLLPLFFLPGCPGLSPHPVVAVKVSLAAGGCGVTTPCRWLWVPAPVPCGLRVSCATAAQGSRCWWGWIPSTLYLQSWLAHAAIHCPKATW